jgi:hypothetical protein
MILELDEIEIRHQDNKKYIEKNILDILNYEITIIYLYSYVNVIFTPNIAKTGVFSFNRS